MGKAKGLYSLTMDSVMKRRDIFLIDYRLCTQSSDYC